MAIQEWNSDVGFGDGKLASSHHILSDLVPISYLLEATYVY